MNLLGADVLSPIEITNVDPGQQRPGSSGPVSVSAMPACTRISGNTGSSLNWVKGRHTIAFGGNWAYTQLNIINNNTESDTLGFKGFLNFVEGAVRTGSYSAAFPNANASRYYRFEYRGSICQRQLQSSQQSVLDPGTALGL